MDTFAGVLQFDLLLQAGIFGTVLTCYLKIERRLRELELKQELVLEKLIENANKEK